MNRHETAAKIITGEMKVTDHHKYSDDIIFYEILTEIAEAKEWFEVCSLAQTQIKLIESKQQINKL